MLNKEWNDLFNIVDVYSVDDFDEDIFSGVKKDVAAALASCIDTVGHVDIGWLKKETGLTAGELVKALEGVIYQDPAAYDLHHMEEEDWVLRSQYLSGNIKIKLDIAKKMNRKYNGRFHANVLVLKKIMPQKVNYEDIGICIGSPWIPETYYSQFAKEILGFQRLHQQPEIYFSGELGLWKVVPPANISNEVQNNHTYGTERMSALKIIECSLNGIPVKIYDEVCCPERKSGKASVLNKNETLAAQEKQELLQKEFQKWVGKDKNRVKHLEQIFYETYACNIPGRYNGDFLTFPELNTDKYEPYPYQKDAVARIVLEKDVLLNHKVGSGKTNIMIMGIHERKRMGLSEKNLIVVPNNVLEAFETTHQQLYPNDRILVVHPEEFRPKFRQDILKKIRDEDYTAVYFSFSSFERIEMSRQYKLDKQREQIRRIRSKAAASDQKWEKRRLVTLADRMSEELTEMQMKLPQDKYLCFDELGVTTLVVDEVHNFKNISIPCHAEGVVGMSKNGSKKCDSLYEKVQYVREHDGGVIFATGTPLTNSIADLFVLQKYLQPEQLKLLHLNHFDEWINNFATRRTGFEIDVDSQSFRIQTRFSSFHNIPELTSLFANICDYYDGEEAVADVPECGDYIDRVVERSPEQKEYIDNLVVRTELIRKKRVKATEDNLLKVTHDGRAAALDIRLADPQAKPDITGTKIYACAQNVYQYWKAYPGTAQLVFSDLGTPKTGFNVYHQLKEQLIDMGIPEKEIAYVHDASSDKKRRELFEAVNCASVRVLIGSTSKLGTGVNVQNRLIGIHHLDIPWKPSDIMQREGRLIRQGNRNKVVYRFRYITAGTFDAYSWQILENKQRFISQFMKNQLADRDARDIDDAVLTYAEIKALSVGNPLLKIRIETSNELERVKIYSNQREQELRKLYAMVKETPAVIEKLQNKKRQFKQDYNHFTTNRENMSRADRLAFGEELMHALKSNYSIDRERCFDYVHGFEVFLPAYMSVENPYIRLIGKTGAPYPVDMSEAKAGGCLQRIEHALMQLNAKVQSVEEEIHRIEYRIDQAEKELHKGNRYLIQVSELTKELLEIDEKLNQCADEDEA